MGRCEVVSTTWFSLEVVGGCGWKKGEGKKEIDNIEVLVPAVTHNPVVLGRNSRTLQ